MLYKQILVKIIYSVRRSQFFGPVFVVSKQIACNSLVGGQIIFALFVLRENEKNAAFIESFNIEKLPKENF